MFGFHREGSGRLGLESPESLAIRVRRQVWWAVLSLLLFWPAAIVAIGFALVARRRVTDGDLAGAGQATRASRIACWVSLAVSVFAVIVLLIQGQTKF